MHRVINTFPFALPISVGDVVDISELPERELLIANGYVEPIEALRGGKYQLHVIDEAEALPNGTFEKTGELQIGIDAGVASGDKTKVVVAKTKSSPAKKPKVEAK